MDWPQQALESSAKIHVSYVKYEHNRSSEQFARQWKVTLELIRKIRGTVNVVAESFQILTIKGILSPSPNTSLILTSESLSNPKASKQR